MLGKAKIFYYGRVVDNQDIYGLNRVRVFPETEDAIRLVLKKTKPELLVLDNIGEPKDVIEEAWYTINDPFAFYPLLPPYLSFIPKIGEMVWVTYSMLRDKLQRKEQFYIPGPKTSPFNIAFEEYNNSKVNTSQGFNTRIKPALKSVKINGPESWSPSHLYGIWAEPGDNAIYGQGTTDLILKRDEILLRAGKKSTMLLNDIPNDEDKRNLNLGFLQISNYTTKKFNLSEESTTTNEIDEAPLKFLIEYELENPENAQDVYNGTITLLEVSKAELRNNEFTSNTPVDPTKASQYWSYQFRLEPMTNVVQIINDVINGLNQGKIVISGTPNSSGTTLTLCDDVDANGECGYCGRCFPFYYRPTARMRTILSKMPDFTDNPYSYAELYSVSRMVTQVRFTRAFLDVNGDGLVSKKDKFGVSKKKKKYKNIPQVSEVKPNSVSILGGNKIILYSQDSQIDDKKINLSGDSIYGISQKDIFNEILPKTDATVRGDKLKEFLTLLMRFVLTHVHPYHGTPPNPVSFSQVSIAQIEQEFQNYDSKVLNQNIRIN